MSRITAAAVSALARVVRNAATLYSWDFTSGLDSWTGFGALNTQGWSKRQPEVVHSAGGAVTQSSTRVVTGLTIGRTYTLLALVGLDSGTAPTAKVGVSGIGSGATLVPTLRRLQQVSYEFVATANSHTMQMTSTATAAMVIVWDAIRLIEHESQIGADIPLELRPGSRIELDERRAPFVQASLRIALPADADLELLDTRSATQSVRVVVDVEQEMIVPAGADQSRTFDMLLHERLADFAEGTDVTLICHSDEARLIDDGNGTATTDATAALDDVSLRAIVSTKLQSRGMFLEAGAADADYTVTTEKVNELLNPGAEVNGSNWFASTGCSAVARSTTVGGSPGAASIRATASAATMRFGPVAGAGVASAIAVDGLNDPGEVSFAVRLRGQVARSAHIELVFLDAGGSSVGTFSSATIVTSTTGWTDYRVTGLTPSTAVAVRPMIEVAGNVVGQFTYADAAICIKDYGIFYIWDPWDGDTATDAYYDYVWDGTAGGSTSRRVRLDDRDPLLLNQDPGETDWDFLQPLVQAAGLRLFCDELRRWYLVDPDTYTVAGTIDLDDPKRADDRISRDRGDWADKVVVKYSWIGAAGTPQVRYDVAGSGTMLVLIEWDRPYPGPGAAAAILARYQGRGRVQSILAGAELAASPAMAVTTELPHTPPQEGVISRVRFDLDVSSIAMTITPRDLEDA